MRADFEHATKVLEEVKKKMSANKHNEPHAAKELADVKGETDTINSEVLAKVLCEREEKLLETLKTNEKNSPNIINQYFNTPEGQSNTISGFTPSNTISGYTPSNTISGYTPNNTTSQQLNSGNDSSQTKSQIRNQSGGNHQILYITFIGPNKPELKFIQYNDRMTVNDIHSEIIKNLNENDLKGHIKIFMKKDTDEIHNDLIYENAPGYDEVDISDYKKIASEYWGLQPESGIYVKIESGDEIILIIRPLGTYPFRLEFERTSSLLNLQKTIKNHMSKNLDNTFNGEYKIYLKNECLNDFDDIDDKNYIDTINSTPLNEFGIIDGSELTIEKNENNFFIPEKEINRRYSNVKNTNMISKAQKINNEKIEKMRKHIAFATFDRNNDRNYYNENSDDEEELTNNYRNKLTIPTTDNLMIKAMKPYYPHMNKPHMNPELFPEYNDAMRDIDIINKQRKIRLMRNDIIV